jgi:hypothetical protein
VRKFGDGFASPLSPIVEISYAPPKGIAGQAAKERTTMRKRVQAGTFTALAITLATAAAPALAHHSFAMFDNSRALLITGSVEKFQWTNPHSYLEMDVAGKHYTLEMTSPNMMSRAGWTARSVKAGEQVSALIAPLRDGRPGGMVLEVRFPDGHVLVNPVPNPQNYSRTVQ